jgi:hypothetical protein
MLPRHVFVSYGNASRFEHLSQQIAFLAYLTTLQALNADDYCEAVEGMIAGSRNGSAWRLKPCSRGGMPGINSRRIVKGRVVRTSEGAKNLSSLRRSLQMGSEAHPAS